MVACNKDRTVMLQITEGQGAPAAVAEDQKSNDTDADTTETGKRVNSAL
jgi:hypothetical protein